MSKLFTIGHSTHPIELFLGILKRSQINAVIDVRSVPYSQYANQYNKDNLELFLKANKIYYIPMGHLLGARYEDESLLFDDGKVCFDKVTKTKDFNDGIRRIDDGLSKNYIITLMCSEKNPLECHRFSLISHFLDEHGYEVEHILPDKTISHRVLDEKLYEYYKSKRKITFEIKKILNTCETQNDLFDGTSKSDLYLALNKLIAYNQHTKEERAE